MSFVTKEWKDRLAEFAGRRKLTNVSTGEETTVDVSRAEGEVSQAGDAFSAANMNDLEQRIKDGFDKVDTNLYGVVVWENQNPSASFPAQTISLDLREYNYFDVIIQNTTTSLAYNSNRIYKNLAFQAFVIRNYESVRTRSVKITDTSVIISDGQSTGTTDNASAIPLKIVAYK